MVDGQHGIAFDTDAAGFGHATSVNSSSPLRRLRSTRAASRPVDVSGAIEVDIVPRLVMARGWMQRPDTAVGEARPDGADLDVEAFANLLLIQDADKATSYAFNLFAHGTSAEALFLALLAPAARNLGDRWMEDRCSFADVTLGMWRLQQIMRDLTPAFHRSAGRIQSDRGILLVNLPEEQHTFGLTMLAEFFRRARWNVTCSNPVTRAGDATDLVRAEWFNVVGLTLSSEHRLEELARLIRAIRRKSLNRAVGIMVGGPVFLEHPEFVARVGADITAIDGRTAPLQADVLAGRGVNLLC